MIEDDRDELSTDPEHDNASDMRLSRYESAIRRWVAALNGRADLARIEAAVHPEVRVARHGFGANVGKLMQTIQGTSGVAEWFGLTPAPVEFELAGPVEFETAEPGAPSDASAVSDGGEVAQVRYQVDTPGFRGGGTWQFRLADDDRIIYLEHWPDDIPDSIPERTSRTDSNREEHHDDPHHLEHHH
jgi:hypothetical protein